MAKRKRRREKLSAIATIYSDDVYEVLILRDGKEVIASYTVEVEDYPELAEDFAVSTAIEMLREHGFRGPSPERAVDIEYAQHPLGRNPSGLADDDAENEPFGANPHEKESEFFGLNVDGLIAAQPHGVRQAIADAESFLEKHEGRVAKGRRRHPGGFRIAEQYHDKIKDLANRVHQATRHVPGPGSTQADLTLASFGYGLAHRLHRLMDLH